MKGSKLREREGAAGSGKVHEQGFEFGTPVAQQRCIGADTPGFFFFVLF